MRSVRYAIKDAMRGVFADRAATALAVVLFAGLEGLTIVSRFYWPIFVALLLALVVGTFVALSDDLRTRGPHVAILPVTYVVSVLLFHLFVPRGVLQHLFVVATTAGFLLLIARATEWAYPTWTWLFTSLTFFLFASGAYGLTFHLRFPLWATGVSIGLMTGLLTYHVVGRAFLDLRRRLFWSMLLSLLILELLIVLAFFPLAYRAVGGALFVAFYLFLHLLQRHVYDRLTRAVVCEYLGLAAVAVTLILATAEWRV